MLRYQKWKENRVRFAIGFIKPNVLFLMLDVGWNSAWSDQQVNFPRNCVYGLAIVNRQSLTLCRSLNVMHLKTPNVSLNSGIIFNDFKRGCQSKEIYKFVWHKRTRKGFLEDVEYKTHGLQNETNCTTLSRRQYIWRQFGRITSAKINESKTPELFVYTALFCLKYGEFCFVLNHM